MLVAIIVATVVGIVLGFFIPTLLVNLYANSKIKELNKLGMPNKVSPDKLCKGPHSWIKTKAKTTTGIEQKQLCRICGFVSGTDYMANQETIDAIEDQNLELEKEEKLYKEFLDKEDNEIKQFFAQEIRAGLDLEKLLKVHTAGMTFVTRFSVYRTSTEAEKVSKELERGNA